MVWFVPPCSNTQTHRRMAFDRLHYQLSQQSKNASHITLHINCVHFVHRSHSDTFSNWQHDMRDTWKYEDMKVLSTTTMTPGCWCAISAMPAMSTTFIKGLLGVSSHTICYVHRQSHWCKRTTILNSQIDNIHHITWNHQHLHLSEFQFLPLQTTYHTHRTDFTTFRQLFGLIYSSMFFNI